MQNFQSAYTTSEHSSVIFLWNIHLSTLCESNNHNDFINKKLEGIKIATVEYLEELK